MPANSRWDLIQRLNDLNDNTCFVRTAMHTFLFLSLEWFEVAYVTPRSQARSVTRRYDHTPHSRNDRTSFAGRGLWCTPCSASGRRYASKIMFWLGFHHFRGQRTYILALCCRKGVEICISFFFSRLLVQVVHIESTGEMRIAYSSS